MAQTQLDRFTTGVYGEAVEAVLKDNVDATNDNFDELYAAVRTSAAANRVLATPDNAAGLPTMRALVWRDLSSDTPAEGDSLVYRGGAYVHEPNPYNNGDWYQKPADSGFDWLATFIQGVRRNLTTMLPEVIDLSGGVFDVADLAATPAVTYYVGYTGDGTPSDANTGLTKAQSFLTMGKALSMSPGEDITVSVYAGTTFLRTDCFPTGVGSRNVNIIGDGGAITFSAHDNWTWSVYSGTCYQTTATMTLVNSVWDALNVDANGDYTRLTLAADLATCAATPGTFFVTALNSASSYTVYVNLSDGRNPDTNDDVRIFRSVYNGMTSPGYDLYLENCYFHGGLAALTHRSSANDQDTRIFAKGCRFKYAGTYNNLNTLGLKYGIFQSCDAGQGVVDGFNHHDATTINALYVLPKPKIIEINCVGRDNGWGMGNTNNGSSVHDGGSILRVDTQSYRNNGPNIADATSGTTVWNVACTAYDSTGTGTSDGNYYTDSAKVWCDSCMSFGSDYGVIITGSGGAVYVRQFSGKIDPYLAAGATLRAY